MTAAVWLMTAGCEPPPEGEVESVGQEAISLESPVDVGFGIKRPRKITCGRGCVEWAWKPVRKNGPPVRTCVRTADDCNATHESVRMYPDQATRNADTPSAPPAAWLYPPAEGKNCGYECIRWSQSPPPKPGMPPLRRCIEKRYSCSPWGYRGCGPQAAMNVLHFYGVEMGIMDVEHQIETIWFPGGSIGTTPNALARDLQTMLNAYADGIFTVRKKSYADIRWEVHNSIRRGAPIIVLVNEGTHYQVVTGYDSFWKFHMMDYPPSGFVRNDWDLGTSNIIGSLVFGYDGYEPYTVITIERRPR